MKALAVITLSGLALAACGERAEPAAPTPVEAISAVQPASDAQAGVPVVLNAAELRRVCRAGLAAIHGQDLEAIQIDGLEGSVVNASWRAPVDGGRRLAKCRVEDDRSGADLGAAEELLSLSRLVDTTGEVAEVGAGEGGRRCDLAQRR